MDKQQSSLLWGIAAVVVAIATIVTSDEWWAYLIAGVLIMYGVSWVKQAFAGKEKESKEKESDEG